ncbi:MAG: hypothetical protein U0270_24550 [Labilithrix sp.]
MKIGFLGNTNNYPFLIARALRALGHDVLFFVDQRPSERLHRPECHSVGISFPYPSWIRDVSGPLSTLKQLLPEVFSPRVVAELLGCDAVVVNGLAHGVVAPFPKWIPSYHLFSGSDLDVLASEEAVCTALQRHPRLSRAPRRLVARVSNAIVSRHRAGIRRAAGVAYFPRGLVPAGDQLLDGLIDDRVARFAHWHVVTEGLAFAPAPNRAVMRLFNLTRFLWKEPLPPGYAIEENKRNDVLVRGIALFVAQTGRPLDVRFVEKGVDVAETKRLVQECGIAHLVTWLSEMSFAEVIEEYRTADVVTEQFGQHVFTGGLYPMLIGRPVIGNGRPEIIFGVTNQESPICQARTPAEVASWLAKLDASIALRNAIGIASREYVLQHCDIRHEASFVAETLEWARLKART